MFTMLADFSHTGDSQQIFALNGFSGGIAPQDPNRGHDEEYIGKTDLRDPVLVVAGAGQRSVILSEKMDGIGATVGDEQIG